MILQQVFGARNTIYGLRQISERSSGAFLRECYRKGARALGGSINYVRLIDTIARI